MKTQKSNSDAVTLREHLEALRESDQRALSLSAEYQRYKDEKANDLRSQIESERGTYATHKELQSAIRELKAGLTDAHDQKRLDTGQILTIILLCVVAIGTILSALHI